MTVSFKPEGYHTITPYLVVPDVAEQLEFLEAAFDAVVTERLSDGTVNHAEVAIGDSRLMIGRAPAGRPPTSAMLYVYVPDADATYRRALDAGATSVQEPADAFYGDRNAGVADPAGNQWWVATHLEDVGPDELARRNREARG